MALHCAVELEGANLDQSSLDVWPHARGRGNGRAGAGRRRAEPDGRLRGRLAARRSLAKGWHRRSRAGMPKWKRCSLPAARPAALRSITSLWKPCCHTQNAPLHRARLAGWHRPRRRHDRSLSPGCRRRAVRTSRRAGVEVQSGVLESDARKLNSPIEAALHWPPLDYSPSGP